MLWLLDGENDDVVVLFGPVILAPPLPDPPVNCERGISTCSETGGSVNLTLRLLSVPPFGPSPISPISRVTGDSVRFRIEAVGDAPLGEGTNFCHGFVRVLSD